MLLFLMFRMKISYSFKNIAKYILLSEEVNQSDVSYCGIKTAQVFNILSSSLCHADNFNAIQMP